MRSTPPRQLSPSTISTSWPAVASAKAAESPAGPLPTTATRRGRAAGAGRPCRGGDVVADPALQPADLDRAVVGAPVARRHAGGGADPPAHRRERLGPEEHLGGRLDASPGERLDEAHHVVPGRAAGVAGRGVGPVVRHLGAPRSGLERRGEVGDVLGDADHAGGRGARRTGASVPVVGLPHQDRVPGLPRGGEIALEPLRGEGPLHRVPGQPHGPGVGAEQRGVDDDDRARPDAVAARDGGGVHGGEAEVAVPVGEGLEPARRVEEHHRPRLGPLEHVVAEEGGVEDDQVVRPVDLVAVADGNRVHAGEGADGRSGPLRAVVAEGLGVEPLLRVDGGDELGAGDAALAAAPVDAHLEREGDPGRQGPATRLGHAHRLLPSTATSPISAAPDDYPEQLTGHAEPLVLAQESAGPPLKYPSFTANHFMLILSWFLLRRIHGHRPLDVDAAARRHPRLHHRGAHRDRRRRAGSSSSTSRPPPSWAAR